jgi:thiosulfate reductase cytochrome b subunit
MADAAFAPDREQAFPAASAAPRHTALVRVTHWITAACFLALLLTGIEIVISHPRFYWGETGNVNTPALFHIPIPASRGAVQTGYGYVLPDQNGWSRSLHFQSAWFVMLTGLLYVAYGLIGRHFRQNVVPRRSELNWRSIAPYLRFSRAKTGDASAYNVLQKVAYLVVVFVLFPGVIWTGLAMSPGAVSAFPALASVLGGQQTARTLHFFITILLTLFFVIHIAMIVLAGFWKRTLAMITGGER